MKHKMNFLIQSTFLSVSFADMHFLFFVSKTDFSFKEIISTTQESLSQYLTLSEDISFTYTMLKVIPGF